MWRVSSREQRDGFSIDAQRREGLRYAERRGIDIVKEFEAAESAKKDGRKVYAQFIEYARKHTDVEIMLVEKADRLSRNFMEYMKAATLVDEHDKEIHFFKIGRVLHRDSPAADWFATDIDISVGAFGSRNLSQEARKGLREKAEQGLYPSNAPFCYVNNKMTRSIDPDRERMPLFVRMAEIYATGRSSLEQIADRAYEAGLHSRKGRRINTNSWWLYFQNPVYAGKFYWEGRLHNGTYEPLWSWEMHLALLDALHRDGKPRGRKWGKKEAIVFRGMGRCSWQGCPDPGRVLTGDGPKKGNADYVYYRCSIHAKPAIRQDRMAELLGEGLKDLAIPPDILEWVRAELRKSHDKEREYHAAAVKGLEQEYDRLQRYVEQTYEDKLEGHISVEDWQRRTDGWRRRQAEIEGQLARQREVNQEYLEDGVRLLELAQRAHEIYVRANLEEKREILEIALSNFSFDGVNIVPVWNKPFDALVKAGENGEWLGA